MLVATIPMVAQTGNWQPGPGAIIQPGPGDLPPGSLRGIITERSSCANSMEALTYQFQFFDDALQGPVSLSATDIPAEVQINFSSSTAEDGDLIELTVSGIDDLAPGFYPLVIRAQDGIGMEDLILTLQITPDPVTELYPLNGEQVEIKNDGHGRILFTYDAISGATNYTIVGDEFGPIDNDLQLERLVDFGPVVPGVRITYRLEAELADSSLISCDRTLTFVAPLPVEWLDFQTRSQETGVLISWRVQQDGRGEQFIIERRKETDTFFSPIARLNDDQQLGIREYQYLDEELEAGCAYFYRVLQQDLDGNRSYSPMRRAVASGVTEESFMLVPNPVFDYAYIYRVGDDDLTHFRLLDLRGRILLQAELQERQTEVSLNGLAAGIYHLQLINDKGEQQHLRLVKR